MNPARGAGDGRQEVDGDDSDRAPAAPCTLQSCFPFLVLVLVRLARVKKLSVPVPVPRRSAPAVMPEAEVEHMKDVGGAVLDGASEWAGLENAVLGSEWLEVKQQ